MAGTQTPPAPDQRSRKVQRLIYALIAAAIIVADQTTKALVVKLIPEQVVIPVIPGFFNLLHTENSGIAFSLLADWSSSWKMVVLIGVSAALLVTVLGLVWKTSEVKWTGGIGLALILGGALSNLADRIRYGQVVDFLDFYYRSYHWPAFNVADSAIVIGAGLLVIEFLSTR